MKNSILNLDKLVLNKEVMLDLSSGQMSNLKGGVTHVTDNGCVSHNTMCGSEHSRCISVCEENCTGTDTFTCTMDHNCPSYFPCTGETCTSAPTC